MTGFIRTFKKKHNKTNTGVRWQCRQIKYEKHRFLEEADLKYTKENNEGKRTEKPGLK